ncbi:glycosyltransferase [Halpernia sp. GG3]
MTANTKICVVIPVKDEENYIEKTLRAFFRQIDHYGDPLDHNCFEVLILANNCSDQSVVLIENFCKTTFHFKYLS